MVYAQRSHEPNRTKVTVARSHCCLSVFAVMAAQACRGIAADEAAGIWALAVDIKPHAGKNGSLAQLRYLSGIAPPESQAPALSLHLTRSGSIGNPEQRLFDLDPSP
jgi:hypothetical protein